MDDNSIEDIVAMTERAQAQFLAGDSSGYEELFAHREDVSLAGPFGGSPLVGWSTIAPRMRQAAALFDAGGTGSIEVFQAIVRPDLVCLVTVERDRVRFVHDGTEGRWELRVTQVYELMDDKWRVVHRHADPLTERHAIDDILTFAYVANLTAEGLDRGRAGACGVTEAKVLLPAEAAQRLGVPTRIIVQAMYERKLPRVRLEDGTLGVSAEALKAFQVPSAGA